MLNISNRISINTIGGGGDGLTKIFTDYGFLNMWSTDNMLVSGTTTTLYDYAGEHDLVNPAAVNQPTFNATDSDFNNKPSIEYDGIAEYIQKAVSNYRTGDTDGVAIIVLNDVGGASRGAFNWSNAASEAYFAFGTTNNKAQYVKSNAVPLNSSATSAGSKVIGLSFDGVNGKSFEDGVEVTFGDTTAASGWLDLGTSLLTSGALIKSATLYYNTKVVFFGYMPFVSDAQTIALQNELKTYYGI